MAGVSGVASIDSFVSRFTGLVEYVYPMSFAPDAIPDILFSSKTADAGYLTGVPADPFSMGPGSTTMAARRACIGEALERYSLASARSGISAAVGSDPRQVVPDAFSRFAESQYATPGFRFERVREGDSIEWVGALDVATGDQVLVPAQMVLFVDPHGRERPYESATSSGVAAGPGYPFAAKRAILELLERDAFQRTWLMRRRPPALDWRRTQALDARTVLELDRLERLCSRFGAAFTLRVLDSALGVPVLLAVLRSGITGVAVGCAADLDLDRAALNAVREAVHTHNWCLRLLADPVIDPAAITSFEQHVAFHARPSARRHSSDLDASTETMSRVPAARSWADVVGALAGTGTRVFLVDVTSVEIAEAGYRVVRALSPDLVPLDVLHDARFLGNPALYDSGVPAPELLNPLPHPFP